MGGEKGGGGVSCQKHVEAISSRDVLRTIIVGKWLLHTYDSQHLVFTAAINKFLGTWPYICFLVLHHLLSGRY